ncbi:MAG TPA: hypothetical protein VJ733_10075 [Candidatus Binatia bacterium]|nr:hypothetical protein [Candidatus Binatia bacterium]
MDIQFQEIQYLPELTFALVIGLLFHILLLYRRVPLPLNVTTCVLLFPILLLAFELETVVHDEVIQIRFGRIPLIQHTIPLYEVTGYKAITYVHVGDTLGVWQDEPAIPPFVPTSEQALLLELKDGSRYLIASRRIKELQQVIEEGRKTSGNRV